MSDRVNISSTLMKLACFQFPHCDWHLAIKKALQRSQQFALLLYDVTLPSSFQGKDSSEGDRARQRFTIRIQCTVKRTLHVRL